jgi:hypothetical protein
MLTTQLENVAQLGKFPITTTELDRHLYNHVYQTLPLLCKADTKHEVKELLSTLKLLNTAAQMSALPHFRVIGVVYVPEIQRFSLFAAHKYGIVLVDLMQSVATTWSEGRHIEEPVVVAWYPAEEVQTFVNVLKDATDIHITIDQESLTAVGTLKTGQRYLVELSKFEIKGPPVSVVNLVSRSAQPSIVFQTVASLADIKKRGREVVKLLRDKDKKRYIVAELHLFTKDDEQGAVFYQFPQVSDASFVIFDTTALNPFDLVALNPELLMLPDRGSVSMYIPPAEPESWELEGSSKKYVQKPIQLHWSRGYTVTWELLMPMVPYYLL